MEICESIQEMKLLVERGVINQKIMDYSYLKVMKYAILNREFKQLEENLKK